MIYLWILSECPNKHIAVYDREASADYFMFRKGIKLTKEQVDKPLIFSLEVTQAEILRYDAIPNNSASPLVNQKIIDILLELAPDDVQFFDAQVRCKDGTLTSYKLLNIAHEIFGIDHEHSVYTLMKMSAVKAISGFRYLTYLPRCMGKHKLARDKEYRSNLLSSEEVKQAFERNKIKGVRFVKPEDFYGPKKYI